MRHRADKLAVLDYRAAGHALYYPAGTLYKLRVGDAEHGVRAVGFTVDAVEDGAFKFAYFCCDLPVFRRTMITGRSR